MKTCFRLGVVLGVALAGLVGISAQGWQSDNGDGTYSNPVLHADYPDPDIIRVGADFYMVSSTFVSSPGLTVLRSRDMVNWEIAGHAASTVDGGDAYDMVGGTAYEGGFWAPSIRHRDGTFYIAVQPTYANGRIYYAADPAGPWDYHQLDRNIYDPGLFFDDDGTGYIVCGHGPQSVMTLNGTCSAIVAEQTGVLDSGGEGSHVVRRGSYYYVFNANPGVWPFQLRCARTTDLVNGPWETGHICLTAADGGHQGAIVDIDDGDNWFGFVHQDSGAVGRMPRIGPVYWSNNWPVFGTPANPDVMAETYTKPVAGQPVMAPATSDDFSASALGLQWQWNHNPDNTRWSLSERPGHLRLRPTPADDFWTARNTLTRKGQGPRSHGIVKLDLANLQPGDVAGFGTLGRVSAHIHVTRDAGGNRTLGMTMRKDKVGEYAGASGIPFPGDTLYLRTDLDFTDEVGVCAYSADGIDWTTLGGTFELMFGYGSTWQGEQFAVFCYNPGTASSTGYVDVDAFTFGETADLVSARRGRPRLNAARTTFVGDNGQLLRGPYESTEWTTAAPEAEIAAMKDLGFNAVHLYAEVFDPAYPDAGSRAPGYAVAEVDKMVQMTRELGLYLVMTIGNGANNGNHNYAWAYDFWDFYAPRYADETHVLYEVHNEPLAWGPSYLTGTTPPGTMDLEIDAYRLIRSHAPDTPVLLLSYAVLADAGGASAALTDIEHFNQQVFGTTAAVWTNEAVGFHGYGGWDGTAEAVEALIAAGYPCFMTEFGALEWGGGGGGFGVEQTSELERLGVSWTCFQYIPPSGVSEDVTVPEHYRDRVDRAGLSWTPDYGTWPVARGPYGNGGQPRATATARVGDVLTGTLRIQAEDYDTGGEGVAYHDTWSVNEGGHYRPGEGVDLQSIADAGGGYAVGWTGDGEWLEYTVWVMQPGFYDLALRYATPNSGGTARVLCNGKNVTGDLALPVTGGWDAWHTATRQVFLEFGRQRLRVEIPAGGFDLNWIELTPATDGPVADGAYKLVNRHSGQVMHNDTAVNDVVQQAYTGASAQRWNLEHLGAGQYRVRSAADNWYWNVWSGPGNPLELVWWGGSDPGDHQRYIVRPAGNGYYRIAPVAQGYDVEVDGAALTHGAPVVQQEYTGAGHQQWGIVPPSAPAIPTGLSAVWAGPARVDLEWTAAAGATGYHVKRSAAGGGPYTTLATGVTGTGYSDTGVTGGGIYYYVVSAVGPGGESLDSAEARTPGLRARLRFDETGGDTASDATGNGWDGTLVGGPAWTEGRSAGAVDLDGVDDHVTLPAGVVDGLTRCTIAAWVRLDTVSDWARVFDFGTGSGVNMFLTPRNGITGTARFAITTGGAGGEQQINSGAPLPSGAWTHLAVTLDGPTGILYVDGVEAGRNSAMTLAPSSLGATTRNYIGRSQYADPYLDGRVDDFRIYDSVLGAADIAALVTDSAPAAPAGVIAEAAATGQINLFWTASPDAAGYHVKRAAAGGGPYTTIAAGVTGTSYLDAGLPAGSYYYVVSAVNAHGESADSAEATPPDLHAHLRFDETGGTTALDATGHGWNGILVNGALRAAGVYGNSGQMDGVDDHVRLPAGVVGGLTRATFSAWVHLDAVAPWVRVFDFGTGTTANMFLTADAWGPARFAITTGGGGAEQQVSGSAPLPTGQWTHLAVTLDGPVGILYVNGSEAGRNSSMTLTPSSLGTTTANYIGRSQYADPYLDGRVDDVRIYAEALSPPEVAALAALHPPAPPAGLAAVGADGEVSLSWDSVLYADSYRVKRSPESGGPYAVVGSPSAAGFVDTGLTNAAVYYYVVSALGSHGESGDTAEVAAVPSPDITPEEYAISGAVMVDGTSLGLTAPDSVPGHLYQVLATDSLLAPEWLPEGSAAAGNGADLLFGMPLNGGRTNRYFKLDVQRQ